MSWFHVSEAPPPRGVGDYLGSPMYEVLPEHGLAVAAVALLPVAAWLLRRRAGRAGWAALLVDGYQALPAVHRFVAWLLAASGVAHLALVLTHEPSALSGLFAVAGVAMLWVVHRLVAGRPWRARAGLVLVGSLLAYAASSAGGEPPDQVGLAVKLVELAALTVVVTPAPGRRLRRVAASGGVVALAMAVAIGAWAGAFQAGEGGHHTVGATPPPGVLLPDGEERWPTGHEMVAAQRLYDETVRALEPYRDPAVAAAAGYRVEGMWGTDFHADNPAYLADGRILDPQRPETLVYAVGAGGPVLLGAMFQMPDIGRPGPAVGGPLTVWHAHDHVCFALTPPAIAGLVSPFGTCPLGSVAMPITHEMIHVWTAPGAPSQFGDLDDEWLAAYLAGG